MSFKISDSFAPLLRAWAENVRVPVEFDSHGQKLLAYNCHETTRVQFYQFLQTYETQEIRRKPPNRTTLRFPSSFKGKLVSNLSVTNKFLERDKWHVETERKTETCFGQSTASFTKRISGTCLWHWSHFHRGDRRNGTGNSVRECNNRDFVSQTRVSLTW